MYQAAERIYEAFLRKNIKCKLREKGGMSLVETAFSNTDGNDVALRVSGLVKFPPERLPRLYEACNELNRKYRFAKFVIDPEKAVVNMEMDIPSSCENVGAVAEELLVRAVAILDESIPRLMQATWA